MGHHPSHSSKRRRSAHLGPTQAIPLWVHGSYVAEFCNPFVPAAGAGDPAGWSSDSVRFLTLFVRWRPKSNIRFLNILIFGVGYFLLLLSLLLSLFYCYHSPETWVISLDFSLHQPRWTSATSLQRLLHGVGGDRGALAAWNGGKSVEAMESWWVFRPCLMTQEGTFCFFCKRWGYDSSRLR